MTPQVYTSRVTLQIRDLLKRQDAAGVTLPPPILCLATDTQEFVTLFLTSLQGIVDVLEWEQPHAAPGAGVYAGNAHTTPFDSGDSKCLKTWSAMLTDMILLAESDVLIAGTFSSFSQSMPMSSVLGRPHKKLPKPFCEVEAGANSMVCHSSVMEWCNVTGWDNNVIMTLDPEGGWDQFLVETGIDASMAV